MRLIYNFGLKIYLLLVKMSASKNPKARKWLDGRKKLLKRIKAEVNSSEKCVWPEKKIVLTFFSTSGYEVQKDYKNPDYICYLPLDTRRNAKRFIKLIN